MAGQQGEGMQEATGGGGSSSTADTEAFPPDF